MTTNGNDEVRPLRELTHQQLILQAVSCAQVLVDAGDIDSSVIDGLLDAGKYLADREKGKPDAT